MSHLIRVFVALFSLAIPSVSLACANGAATTFQWPTSNWVTGCNDYWSTCNGNHHLGSDGPAGTGVIGQTVYAACTGVVKEAQFHNGYGGTVIIECYTGTECVSVIVGHMFPSSYTYNGVTYGGLQVSAGQNVNKGAVIGYLADQSASRNGNWTPHPHVGIHKGSYSSTPTNSCDGGWSYAGYTSNDCVEDDWYAPDEFIATHSTTSSYSSPSNPVTSSAPSSLSTAKDARQNEYMGVLETYAGYQDGWSALTYLGTPFMSFEHWYNNGTITYDDGVASDAYLQRYGLLSNGDTNGVVIVHPDTGMAVDMWGHTWRFWERGSASGYSYTDNCGVNWFANGTGPKSEFGLPITTEYYVESNNRWRRDFQRGYMAWDPTNNIMYLNCYTAATPGWTQWSGWDGDISVAVAQAYERNGAKEVVGYAYDNGGGSTVHIWGGVLVQDYTGGENGDNAIIVNLDGLGASMEMSASVVRNGFWGYYKQEDGHVYFGAPLGDEMDLNEMDGYLRGYDPYCDTNTDGWVDLWEREDCIDAFCGTLGYYTSMQRFDEVTLCWNEGTDVVDEY